MSELICTKCGAPLQNNSFYCSKCGARVNPPVKIEVSEKILAKRAKDKAKFAEQKAKKQERDAKCEAKRAAKIAEQKAKKQERDAKREAKIAEQKAKKQERDAKREAKREKNRIKRQTPAYKKMQKIVGITVPCSVIVTLLLVFLLAPIQASAMGYDISLDNSGGIEIDNYNNKTENPEIPEEMWYLGAMRPVTSISSYAFRYCDSLTSIVIPDSVTTIGDAAFAHCASLTSIVIPDSVTTIGSAAFNYCNNLTSIVIPDSVTTISYEAFDGCYRLTDVYFTGIKMQWEAIVIRYGNEALENATIHYNYIPEQN